MNVNIPGLHNSNKAHWQSEWERQFPEQFVRVNQQNWDQPERKSWVTQIEDFLQDSDTEDFVLVGHSIGCASILHWWCTYQKPIKAAFLVAPSDPDPSDFPEYIQGFSPMPLCKLPFPSMVVASENDHVVNPKRAEYFANQWGSEFKLLPNAGHIEPISGFGKWEQGLEWLQQLRVSSNSNSLPK
jgi:predicted alpha/beta hydrolase family esterase